MILILIILKYAVYPGLRTLAWNVRVERDDRMLHPKKFHPDFGFVSKAPKYDWRGIYRCATHTLMYPPLFVLATITFPLELLLRKRIHIISDDDIFDFCSKTCLILFGKFHETDEEVFVFEMPINSPKQLPVRGNCDIRTLRITFRDREIIRAESKLGQVTPISGISSRNDVLMAALQCIIGHWVHPTIHVAAENCALEIQEKRIDLLEPSSHFTSSLHEGLFTSIWGPWNPDSIMHCGSISLEDSVAATLSHPVPTHVLTERKHSFELYRFILQARRIVTKLVRKYELDINSEMFFLGVVLHAVDHVGIHATLAKLPLYSMDCSGTMWSYWEAHLFAHVWSAKIDNVLNSCMLKNHKDLPFYKELYTQLHVVNERLANEVLVSCCF